MSSYEHLSNKDLEKEIRKANIAYREGNPYLSDEIYDYLYDLLKERDPSNPFFQEIGAPVVEERFKANLPYKMFSLDKIKNEEKPLALWRKKFPGDVAVSYKLDGNSGLFYLKNKEMKLYKRGDGVIGEDISFLIPYISIFKNSKYRDFLIENYKEFAVRGELIINKKDWQEIQSRFPEQKNSRNTVAGVTNAKTPNPFILSKVRFVVYEWVFPDSVLPVDSFHYLGKLGFEVVNNSLIKAKDISLETLSKYLEEARYNPDYEIDGIVVTENRIHPRDETGNPDYSFAFKSLAFQEQVEVTVIDVEWNISKDGLLKPIVYFPPIEMEGVTIQKATGKNAKFIEDNIIGPGAKVIITRAGGVIPDILKVTKIADSGNPSFPQNISFIWNKNHVEIMIQENDASEEVLDSLDLKRLIHFFVKLDTDGVSEGVTTKLYNSGFRTVKSILNITIDELLTVEGFKKKLAEKVRMNLDLALANASPLKLMVASNMFENGFGDKKLKIILDSYPDISDNDKRMIPSLQQLLNLEGIAEITALAFLENLPRFWGFIEENELEFLMKSTQKKKETKSSNLFLQQTFVFSGIRNKDYEAMIEAAGGKVTTSVSKNTNVLIVKDKDETSSKINKAKELGIPIYDIDEVSNYFL
jgi:DNA ligase (NAD+)